jgi:pimeloyl-ACP methyl ester carboxylesterase
MTRSHVLSAAVLLLLCACSSPFRQAETVAARAQLSRALLWGDRYHHVAYQRLGPGGLLLIYIEGDGTPWTDGGRQIAADPTSRRPLALELAARTRTGSVLYLGRPCYLGLAATPECRPSDWTFDRYSSAVVSSLTAAANQFVRDHDIRNVVLIGHSGGGTLAILMAPKVLNLRAVVTIAANLDVKAWTAFHGYLPLSGSLDPADQPPISAPIVEVDMMGERDRDVPPALLGRYLGARPAAQRWTFPDFDHSCCWADSWPALLRGVLARAGLAPASGSAETAIGFAVCPFVDPLFDVGYPRRAVGAGHGRGRGYQVRHNVERAGRGA